jgi:F-type H+-transporting ATPase subunit alpha
MEKQVTILYAGTKGYLDKYPKEAVPAYEAGLYPFVESRFPEVFTGLKEKQKIDDELEAKIKQCLEAYDAEFKETVK